MATFSSPHSVSDSSWRARIGPTARVLSVLVSAVAVASVVTGCVAGDVPAAPADDAELVEGQTLYQANCVACHGTDGGGGSGSRLNGGRLLERYPDPDEQLAIVTDGRRAMPAFSGRFSSEELEAVVRYTREIIAVEGVS